MIRTKSMTGFGKIILRKTYGRRRGRKLRPVQEDLWEKLLPQVSITLEEGLITGPAFAESHFEKRFLEIGFGAGEHLLLQAETHPEVLMVGCEPFVNGVAQALQGIQTKGLKNVGIYPGNALDILEALPDHSLDKVFLLFPDPWPKKAHHKRRFVQKESLDLLARCLKPKGELLMATDHEGYGEWMRETVPLHPDFQWMNSRPEEWQIPPSLWTMTRFQEKALKAGRTPQFFLFQRRES